MKLRISSFIVTLYTLTVAISYLMDRKVSAANFAGQDLIVTRSNAYGSEVAIAVNGDDIVHELDRDKGKKEFVVAANLGTRIRSSSSLELDKVVPHQNVPVVARRVSLPNGSRIHVVLAWGFSSAVANLLELHCKIYIFRENQNKVERIVEAELGDQLIQFIVEDLHKDGNFEVLVTTREGHEQTMYVWQIRTDGEVKKIQAIGGYQISTVADRFMNIDPEIVVEEKAQSPSEQDACYRTTAYQWSAEQQRFVQRRRQF